MPFIQIESREALEGVVVIDFYRDNCGPCGLMEPIINQIASEGVKVAKVNVEEQPHYGLQYNIVGFPTIVVLRHGMIDNVFSGRVPSGRLRDAISRARR